MNENDAPSVWSRYREAKRAALSAPDEPEEEQALTLEQLEQAIEQVAASSGIPETGMPPRSVVHPVKHHRLSLWFYSALLVLFSALVVGMIWWGRNMYG